MGFFGKIKKQAEDPESFLGSLILYGTNRLHANALNWGLSHLNGFNPKEIVELGCGSGRNVAVLLMHYPDAKVTAVEESPYLMEKITANNQKYILAGRCVVFREKLTALKLEKDKYDLAVAFDNINEWKEPKTSMIEAAKILRPGGIFLIINETDGSEMIKARYERNQDSLISYNASEIEEFLTAAGFSETVSIHHPKEPWIAVSAQKK